MDEKEILELAISLYPCPSYYPLYVEIVCKTSMVWDYYLYHNCNDPAHINKWFINICTITGVDHTRFLIIYG